MRTDTHAYAAWKQDPALGVCGECGRDRNHELHAVDGALAINLRKDPVYKSYADAVWDWTLTHGAPRNYYGSREEVGAISVNLHLSVCSIDHSLSQPPVVTTNSEFAGTDAPDREVEVTTAVITCACKAINRLAWQIDGNMTLNEIVFAVVTAGDLTAPRSDEYGECPERFTKALNDWIEKAAGTGPDTDAVKVDLRERIVPAVLTASVRACDTRYLGTAERINEHVWERAIRVLYYGYRDLQSDDCVEAADSIRVLLSTPMPHPDDDAGYTAVRAYRQRYGWAL